MIKKAIIGGTGVYSLEGAEETVVATDYGEAQIYIKEIEGEKIAFLPRHGRGHSLPPHKINYRANIMGLHKLGVEKILATAATGSINSSFPPGSLVILDQFIDFTRLRENTFYDGNDSNVIHVDMKEPYCLRLQNLLSQVSKEKDCELKEKGVYICVDGPRLETIAEINFFSQTGGDLVGMTNVPEVVLARELQMCYAAVGIVVNWCNGMTEEDITHDEVVSIMKDAREKLVSIFTAIFTKEGEKHKEECKCKYGLLEF